MKSVVENEFIFGEERSVFVTGATGLLGSWLVSQLFEAGSNVVCLVRDWVPQSEGVHNRRIEQVVTVRGDITDRALLERVLGEYEVEAVFHVAAQAIVGIANRDPASTFSTNIEGTWNLLEACRRSPKVSSIAWRLPIRPTVIRSISPTRRRCLC